VQLNNVDLAKWVAIYILTALLPVVILYWNKAKYLINSNYSASLGRKGLLSKAF